MTIPPAAAGLLCPAFFLPLTNQASAKNRPNDGRDWKTLICSDFQCSRKVPIGMKRHCFETQVKKILP